MFYVYSYKLENLHSLVSLAVLFNQKLRFDPHIELSVNKGTPVIDFLKEWSGGLDNSYGTKKLFIS